MKTCTKCHGKFSVSNFYKNPRRKDGYNDWCKFCMSLYKKSSYNKEEEKKRHHVYYLSHRQECINRAAKRVGTDSYRFYQRQYQSNRRVVTNSIGMLTESEWYCICLLYDFKCAYCLKECKLEMEHVIPVSRGGMTDITNIIPACHSCNSSKNDRTPIEYFAEV
jgi:5-methylcytosine-specific restriction endonuclease McrA